MLVGLQKYSLSVGSCRSYARTAAQYLERCGAPPNMHHVIFNPELKSIWAEAQMTSAGRVKRAAIIGIRFIRRARVVARRRRHGQEHYTGLLLSFFFFLRISEFSGDGDAAHAGPLLVSDIIFFMRPGAEPSKRRVVLPQELGHLASIVGLRVKGSKTDAAAQGACRCAEQPDAGSGIDLIGPVHTATAKARAKAKAGGSSVLLPNVNYNSYDQFIKAVGTSLGLDTANITSHIGRRSAATALAAAGHKDEVREAGRWSSDAWEQYVETCVHLCEGRSDLMLQEFSFLCAE